MATGVHVAALPVGNQQRCDACGELLLEQNACGMVICTSGPPRLLWWPEGYRVAVSSDGRSAWGASPEEAAANACTKPAEVAS